MKSFVAFLLVTKNILPCRHAFDICPERKLNLNLNLEVAAPFDVATEGLFTFSSYAFQKTANNSLHCYIKVTQKLSQTWTFIQARHWTHTWKIHYEMHSRQGLSYLLLLFKVSICAFYKIQQSKHPWFLQMNWKQGYALSMQIMQNSR